MCILIKHTATMHCNTAATTQCNTLWHSARQHPSIKMCISILYIDINWCTRFYICIYLYSSGLHFQSLHGECWCAYTIIYILIYVCVCCIFRYNVVSSFICMYVFFLFIKIRTTHSTYTYWFTCMYISLVSLCCIYVQIFISMYVCCIFRYNIKIHTTHSTYTYWFTCMYISLVSLSCIYITP